MEDIKFRDYSNILLSGQTQSGKSQFVKKLLINAEHMFVTPPEVLVASKTSQKNPNISRVIDNCNVMILIAFLFIPALYILLLSLATSI